MIVETQKNHLSHKNKPPFECEKYRESFPQILLKSEAIYLSLNCIKSCLWPNKLIYCRTLMIVNNIEYGVYSFDQTERMEHSTPMNITDNHEI